MPIRKTSKKSAGVCHRLTASQPNSMTTNREPRVVTTLGVRRREASLGADASAATVAATLLRRAGKSYENTREHPRPGSLYDAGASRSGGTGRRAGLKIRFPPGSVGSIPTFGTSQTIRGGCRYGSHVTDPHLQLHGPLRRRLRAGC